MDIRTHRTFIVWLGFSCVAGFLCVAGSTLWAQPPSVQPGPQQPRQNALDEYLIPPDFIMQHEGRLKLSPQQRAAIQSETQTLQEQLPQRQAQLQKEVEAMEDLLKKQVRDEAVVLAQLDRLLGEEQQIKRLQLGALLRVRNQLTGPQLTEMGTIRGEMIAARRQLEQRLTEKLRRVQQLVQLRAQSGQPPNAVVQQMQQFPQLMQQGKVEEAEAVLDKSLQQLGGP